MLNRWTLICVVALAGCGAAIAEVDAPEIGEPVLTSLTTICEDVSGPTLDDGYGTVSPAPSECRDLYAVLSSECEDFVTEEGSSPLVGSHKHMCMALASGVAADVNSIVDDLGEGTATDLDTSCLYLDPKWVPTIGNEPSVMSSLCPASGAFTVPFDCGMVDFSDQMTDATVALLHELGGPAVSWVTLDFQGDNTAGIPWYEANLIWFAVIKSLHMQQGAPVVLSFENADGVGAVNVLQVGYEVGGTQAEINAFQAALYSHDNNFSQQTLQAVNLVTPTSIVYRQGGQVRTWTQGVSGGEPLVRTSNGSPPVASTTSDPWQFRDVTAIIDPYTVEKNPTPNPDLSDSHIAVNGPKIIEAMYNMMEHGGGTGLQPTNTTTICP